MTKSERDRCVKIGGPLFDSLIRAHGDESEPGASYSAARMAFDSIVGPVDDACLSAMLLVCSSTKPARWEEAVILLHSSDIVSGARGPGRISSRALSYAVVACAKADRWDEALKLIELYGNEVNNVYPDGKMRNRYNHTGIVSIAAVNLVIRACGRSLRPDIAVQILNDMPTKYGVVPDERSYRLAIIACNQAEHRELRRQNKFVTANNSAPLDFKWWECSLSLLRRMREDGLQPDSQTFSSVVSACEAAGQWQRAIGVLQTMPSFASLLGDGIEENEANEPPNLYCLNAAISACGKGGAWVEAVQLYEHTRSLNSKVRPNFITVFLLLLRKRINLSLLRSFTKKL